MGSKKTREHLWQFGLSLQSSAFRSTKPTQELKQETEGFRVLSITDSVESLGSVILVVLLLLLLVFPYDSMTYETLNSIAYSPQPFSNIRTSWSVKNPEPSDPSLNGSFRKLGVPYFGVLIIRILLFRVLY